MKAITIPEPGDASALVLADVPDPQPAPGEVRVRVAAAGVNRADVMQRMGFYPPPPGAPDYPGLEVSGTVDAARATGWTGWAVGDEVCALLSGGGYAELVCVPAGQLLPVPGRGLARGRRRAARGGEHGVVQRVHDRQPPAGPDPARARRLVGHRHDGHPAGPRGRGAGRRHGRARPPSSRPAAQLGAEILVNYREQDFVEEVRAATGGAGVDVILDNMGAKYLARNVDALAVNGRLVVIGLQGGAKAELDLGLMLRKRVAVIATSLRARPADEKAAIVAAVREHVWPLVESGRVGPVVHGRYPLAEAADAHRELEASGHIGKILLTT